MADLAVWPLTILGGLIAVLSAAALAVAAHSLYAQQALVHAVTVRADEILVGSSPKLTFVASGVGTVVPGTLAVPGTADIVLPSTASAAPRVTLTCGTPGVLLSVTDSTASGFRVRAVLLDEGDPVAVHFNYIALL